MPKIKTLLALLVASGCAGTSATTPSSHQTVPTIESPFASLTVMTFSTEGTLFLADTGTGKIYATTPPVGDNPAAKAGYNLKNADAKIGALLGTTPSNIRVRDLAIHPKSKEAYLAVQRVVKDHYVSAVVVMNQTGQARLLKVPADVKSVQIPFTPAKDFKFYDTFPSRDLTFTDLKVHNGTLYIAGLSNADFASSLWTVPTTFDGKATTTTTEIYHTVHNQQETRAPIRGMQIARLGDTDYLIAAYTCTPLVVFPLSAIKDGAHIKGTTVAELGLGNTPGDLLSFMAQDAKQNAYPVLFIHNKNQGAQIIAMQAIEQAAKGAGLSSPVLGSKVDLNAYEAPMTGILQIDNQDPMHVATVRRDIEEGDLELVSYLKNVYFRLSDFQSEYEIPNYTYPPEQAQIKAFQNQMKQDEGYPQAVAE